MRFSNLFLPALLLLAGSCRKSDHNNIADPVQPGTTTAPAPVTATVQGLVLDENGQPISGAAIKAGTASATTDSRGFFRITRAALDRNAAMVTAEKNGYFKAYRSFPAGEAANNVQIKLLPRTVAGTVAATAGGTVTLSNGTRVQLPANGIVTATGNTPYTGTVSVYVAHIDPTRSDIGQVVPGSFMADDRNGNRVFLESFGMMAVELQGAGGEKLQLKSGSPAQLTFPIPASLQQQAPASIPLWFVDEATGLWKEEGSATRQGNSYIGNVAHFSFWNVDIAAQATLLRLTVKSAADSSPLTNVQVRLSRVLPNVGQAFAVTDSTGQATGLVPVNESLRMELLNLCNNPVYTQTIGPFSGASNMGTVYVQPTNSWVTVSGTLLSCTGTPVTNGYALVALGNTAQYAATGAQGNFTTHFPTCGSGAATSVTIVGVDIAAQAQSSATTFTLSGPSIQVGNIMACGNSTVQFLNYTLDGVNKVLPGDSLRAYTVNFNTFFQTRIDHHNGAFMFLFNSNQMQAGPYEMDILSFLHIDNGVMNSSQLLRPFPMNVTSFPTIVGGFYEGSFSGQFRDQGNTLHTVSGSYRVRRMQ